MRAAANMNKPAASYPAFSPSGSTAQWAKPMPKTRKNFIPRQSWLSYNWIDKDPDLDFVLFAIEELGMTLEQIEYETERCGHKVSRWTLLHWFYHGVRRPQNATMSMVMSVIGWNRPWVRTVAE